MSGGKMIRKLLILLCLLTLMLNGCASEKTKQTAAQENDTEEDSGEKKIQIGLTVDSFVIERWIRDRDVFVATARELGAEVNVQDAGADTKEQISQIDYFIKKHMDVIVIIARDCKALSEAVERAHNAGIRVISYDRMVNDADTDMYISFDDVTITQDCLDIVGKDRDIFLQKKNALHQARHFCTKNLLLIFVIIVYYCAYGYTATLLTEFHHHIYAGMQSVLHYSVS